MIIEKQLTLLQLTNLICKSKLDIEETCKMYMILNIQKQLKEFKVINFNIEYNDNIIIKIEIEEY